MPYDFNDCAADGETDFQSYLNAFFDRDTTRAVMQVFEKLDRSAPEYDEEFVNGTDGPLLLLNRFGLVLRIENAETKQGTRINDSAWIVPALVSIPAGKALIELVPGGFPDERQETIDFLNHALDVDDRGVAKEHLVFRLGDERTIRRGIDLYRARARVDAHELSLEL